MKSSLFPSLGKNLHAQSIVLRRVTKNKQMNITCLVLGRVVIHPEMIDNKMEIDTSVGPSLLSDTKFNELWPGHVLSISTVKLHTYSGEPITVLGMVEADVQYKEQKSPVTTTGGTV